MIQQIAAWVILRTPSSRKTVCSSRFSASIFVCGVLAAVIALSGGETFARTVRIGVYDNPPKVETGDNGTPRGIFIDIIEYIARCEGWDIEYVAGTWDEGLTRLENDSIDLMPDMAFSDDRSLRFDFNQLAVLCSWLQVFSRKGVSMASVSAFEGKTIAILAGSIQQQVCEDIRERLGLAFVLVALPDYDATIRLVESGQADAVVVSRFYGYRREKENTLVPSPIILHPTTLHFAVLKGRNHDLLDAIDKHVADIMNDPRSIYYRSLSYWLLEAPRMFVPPFVIWSIVTCILAILFFLFLSVILRWQVRKRTQELRENNSKLVAAMQELKTAQDDAIKRERLYAIGQLASGVAHDFNNLLSPIIGCVDLMLRDPEEIEDRERVLKHLKVILAAAMHGREIVGRMQQFHRSVAPPVEKEHVDVNAVIREVIELTKARFAKTLPGSTPVKVVLELCANSEISARRTDIHEVFLNLVLNAADAMPEGGRLEISTETRDGTVTIKIKDNGVGMSEEIRNECLQPFFTTKGANGTGMGLTMVKNIVAEHGGYIEIVSTAGAGTNIIITFPCASLY